MTAATGELTIARTFAAPRAAVWRAWADPTLFAKWWIPEPILCRVVKMDMRPGGGFETQMSEDGGATYVPHLEGCFLTVEPEARLVYTTCLTEGWRPFEPWLALTTVITMQDDGTGTRYVARALHRSEEQARQHAEMGFEEGWGITLDQLARVAAGLAR